MTDINRTLPLNLLISRSEIVGTSGEPRLMIEVGTTRLDANGVIYTNVSLSLRGCSGTLARLLQLSASTQFPNPK